MKSCEKRSFAPCSNYQTICFNISYHYLQLANDVSKFILNRGRFCKQYTEYVLRWALLVIHSFGRHKVASKIHIVRGIGQWDCSAMNMIAPLHA